jgi:hypothetical protein
MAAAADADGPPVCAGGTPGTHWEYESVQSANATIHALLPKQSQDALRAVYGELAAVVPRPSPAQLRECTEDILSLTLQDCSAHFQRQTHHASASPADRCARLEWLSQMQACQATLATALESLAYK